MRLTSQRVSIHLESNSGLGRCFTSLIFFSYRGKKREMKEERGGKERSVEKREKRKGKEVKQKVAKEK